MLAVTVIIWVLMSGYCIEEYLQRLFPDCKSAIQLMVEEAELKKEALAEIEIDQSAPPRGSWLG